MAVNRFEQPIASEFINTFVPIPFTEMMQAGQMKQQRYDQGAAAADATIQRAEMFTAIAGTPDDKERIRTMDKLHEIRDSYVGKDLGDSFVYRQLINDINSNIDKPWLQAMQESRTVWDEAQKGKRTLAMNNKWNPALDKDPGSTWNSKEMGVYNYAPQAFQSKDELFRPYYTNVPKDYSKIVKEDGVWQRKYGVSDAKIRSISDPGAQELLSTPGGAGLVELYKQAHPDTELSDTKILQNEMYEYGKKTSSAEYQILGFDFQDSGGRGGGDIQLPAMTTPIESVDSIPGENDKQKQKYLEQEHAAALETVEAFPEGSDERIKAQGILDRNSKLKTIIEKRVEKQITASEVSMRQEAFNKLRSLKAYKDMPDSEIRDAIDVQLGEGLVSSLHRFGTSIDSAQDWSAYGIAKAGEFAVNLLKMARLPVSPDAINEASRNALDELDTSRPFKFSDIFKVAGNTIKHMYKGGTSSILSDQVAKEALNDDMNILRQLSLNLDRRQKSADDEFSKQYLAELQHVNQLEAFYPVSTTKDPSTNIEYITDNTGKKIAPSYTHQFIKGIPSTIDQMEIKSREKDGSYKILDEDGKNEAKGKFYGWDVDNRLTYTGIDKKGNIVLHFGIVSPKSDDSGAKESSEYEIRVPAQSSIGRGLINDRVIARQDEAAIKLSSSALIYELNVHINDRDGHTYNISVREGDHKPVVRVEPDPNSGRYLIQLNGEYLADEEGNPVPLTEHEVLTELTQIQYKALERK